MTPAAIEKREAMAYEQMDREDAFKIDKAACLRASGRMVIDRNGKARRRQEVLNVPGPGDGWACRVGTLL